MQAPVELVADVCTDLHYGCIKRYRANKPTGFCVFGPIEHAKYSRFRASTWENSYGRCHENYLQMRFFHTPIWTKFWFQGICDALKNVFIALLFAILFLKTVANSANTAQYCCLSGLSLVYCFDYNVGNSEFIKSEQRQWFWPIDEHRASTLTVCTQTSTRACLQTL